MKKYLYIITTLSLSTAFAMNPSDNMSSNTSKVRALQKKILSNSSQVSQYAQKFGKNMFGSNTLPPQKTTSTKNSECTDFNDEAFNKEFQKYLKSEEFLELKKYNFLKQVKSLIEDPKKKCLGDVSTLYRPTTMNPLSYPSYNEWHELFKKNECTEQEIQEILEYAHSDVVGNPILFIPAEKQISYDQYCLNFEWIHKDNQNFEKGDHLFGKDQEKFRANILNPLKDWAGQQPGAHIYFWYDSERINPENKEGLEQSIIDSTCNSLETQGISLYFIYFKNIRDIPLVKENTNCWGVNVPVYFRVDLGKATIADYWMTQINGYQYIVNIDSDIVAVCNKQLFDKRTLENLDKVGYTFGSAGMAAEENSFIMLKKDRAQQVHKEIVIDRSIKEVKECEELNKQPQYKNNPKNVLPQYCFERYDNMKSQLRVSYNKNFKPRFMPGGKFMIFPKSAFGNSGYSQETIKKLKGCVRKD